MSPLDNVTFASPPCVDPPPAASADKLRLRTVWSRGDERRPSLHSASTAINSGWGIDIGLRAPD